MMRRLSSTGIFLAILILLFASPGIGLNTGSAWADDGDEWSNPHLVTTSVGRDGRQIDKVIIMGRPPKVKAPVATAPERRVAGVTNSLSDVPAFDWCYGCSATSAAMLCGYYDRTSYPNMYAGPTNGGLCPLDNSTWGPGIGGSDGECPLSATHLGKDGLATRGHVDDYWSSYGSSTDPYYGNWSEHGYADCTTDFMGTNQYHNWQNVDGSTTFFYYTDGSPLYDYSGDEPTYRDGCHGLGLFIESRGYTVNSNYNQYIYGYEGNTLGFNFSQYKAEIDAGQPVLIHVTNHTMLGYGYNDTGNLVYLHDTWDHNDHEMTWGGIYTGGLQHYGVTVIHLGAGGPIPPTVTNSGGATNITSTSARLNGEVASTGGDNPTVHIYWDTTDHGTGVWPNDEDLGTMGTETFHTDISSLTHGTTYYYRCYATNSAGNDWADTTASFTAGMVTLDRQVVASSSDSRVWDSIGSGSWDTTYTTFLAGYMTAEKYKGRSCARFTNITIPQGATITEAHLTLRADRSLSNTTVNSKLACEAVDDAAAFSTYANFTARPRTATVDWNNIPAWTTDTEYNSPDIKSCIQAVINRAGWQSGNDIVVFWEDTGDLSSKNTNTFRCAYSYDKNATYAPKLHIEYSSQPPEPPDAPTPVSPGMSITFKWNASSGATKYHLQVNTESNFTGETKFNAEVGDVTTYEVTSLTLGTIYYWRVKAGNDGGWSDWSSPTRSVLASQVP